MNLNYSTLSTYSHYSNYGLNGFHLAKKNGKEHLVKNSFFQRLLTPFFLLNAEYKQRLKTIVEAEFKAEEKILATTHTLDLFSHHAAYGAKGFRIRKVCDEQVLLKNNRLQRLFSTTSEEDFSILLQSKVTILETDGLSSTNKKFQALAFKALQKYNRILSIQKHEYRDLIQAKIPNLQGVVNRANISRDENFFPPYTEQNLFRKLLNYIPFINLDTTKYFYDTEESKISHTEEASRIFKSTQWERIKSAWDETLRYFRKGETREETHTKNFPNLIPKKAACWWWGHASCMFTVNLRANEPDKEPLPINILTDPVEGDLNSILYPAQTENASTTDQLPLSHIYLLSHNHLDHYNKATIEKLRDQQPVMIVPKGDGNKYRRLGFKNVTETEWGDRIPVQFEHEGMEYTCTISAVPSHHWSGQLGALDANMSLFNGYVISANGLDGDIYFAGDTARLNENHREYLRNNFDIKYLYTPAGPDEAREDMESTHQATVDGLWMHLELFAKKLANNFEGTKAQFLEELRGYRTIFMHTKKYKLGNLHFDDAEESVGKILHLLERAPESVVPNENPYSLYAKILTPDTAGLEHALKEGKYDEAEKLLKECGVTDLRYHEIQAFVEILNIARTISFKGGEKLTLSDIKTIIEESIVIPKIGHVEGSE